MSESPVDIVVADDNEVLLGVLAIILGDCGYSVRTAANGLEALAEVRSRVPDILLSDLDMPHMSGFELLAIMRRCYPKVKAIAMSAAHSGQGVPVGVVADAFYEKGAGSVSCLLEIVNAMKNDSSSSLKHDGTEQWMRGSPFESKRAGINLESIR